MEDEQAKQSQHTDTEKAALTTVGTHNTSSDKGDTLRQPAARSSTDRIIWIMTLLVALVAAALSVYQWLTAQRQQVQWESDVLAAIKRIDEQSALTRQLQRELDASADRVRQQHQAAEQQIDSLQSQLQRQQKRISSLSTTDREDWLLAEAEYLLRLANQRLLMGKEVSGALKLLQGADDIVRELDDQALHGVRKALAGEMAALHTASGFDVEGIYLQLEAVANQADQLRLLTELQLSTDLPAALPAQTWQQRLADGIGQAWQKLGKYIQIRRRDEIYQPLLAPEYEAAMRQNVRLMFEQAQMALLSGKQSLYDNSLSKARQWLLTYYTLDKQATEKVVAIVDSLARQQVAVALPDISASLRALKVYTESLHINKNAGDGGQQLEASAPDTPQVESSPGTQQEQAI